MKTARAETQRRLEIPGKAEVIEGNGGLPKVRVTTTRASGEIYLLGAQVTSWKPAGAQEVLFVSAQSKWQDGTAIRGGVPICFPWFGAKSGDPKAPAHGFLRTKPWQLHSITQSGEAVTVSLLTESSADTKKWWPADFRAIYTVTFDSELSLDLDVTNTGSQPLTFEEALHAYFQVGAIEKARIKGLDGVHYLDKTDANREKTQQGEIAIVSETDRIYLNTTAPIQLIDPARNRRAQVTKQNSRTTVIWNPWIEKAHSLSDFGDDEWQQMLCIETSNVASYAVTIAPGQQHKMKATITLENL